MSKHTEGAFEDGIEAALLKDGHRPANHADDRQCGLLTAELIDSNEDTQPWIWKKLRSIHKSKLEDLFFDALKDDLGDRCISVNERLFSANVGG